MNITTAPTSQQTSTSTTAPSALNDQQIGLSFNNQQLPGNNASTSNHIVNQTIDNHIGATTNNSNNGNNSNHNANTHQLDNGHHRNVVNHVRTSTTASNRMVNAPIVTSTPSLVLSLSQVLKNIDHVHILIELNSYFIRC